MKKKILFVIALLIMTVPNVALANNGCTSTYIGGSNSSVSTGSGGNPGCRNTCLWENAYGFRIRLYSYDGTGSPRALGDGIDVWGASNNDTSKVALTSGARYSNPNNDMVNFKLSNTCDTSGHVVSSKMTLDWNSYKQHKVYFENGLYDTIRNGGLNNYLLNSNGTAGWIYVNLFQDLKNRTTEGDQKIKTL